MKLGSLFSGIGGMDLGFQRCGWEIAWQVEIDDYCRRVLAKHWPNVRRHDDIKTFLPYANKRGFKGVTEPHGDSEEPEFATSQRYDLDRFRVDCICGGFPCQPVWTATGSICRDAG